MNHDFQFSEQIFFKSGQSKKKSVFKKKNSVRRSSTIKIIGRKLEI